MSFQNFSTKKIRKGVGCVLIAWASTFLSQSYAAITVLPVAKITVVENGWYGEGLALHLDSGGLAGCGYPLDFGIDAGHPSYRDLVALALAAQSTGSSVELVVDSGHCIFGSRTYVLSIRLKK